MHRAVMVLVFAAFSGVLHAQAQIQTQSDTLEIRGTVVELDSDGSASLAVAGAQVDLIEFVPVGANVDRKPVSTAYTDPQGGYSFHPDHTGNYYVEVKKEGYRYSSNMVYGAAVKLDQAHPTAQSTFTLRRPGGSISGQVVDEDREPIPDLRIVVQGAGLALPGIVMGGDAMTVTAADGTFTASDVLPGPHVVRISSPARQQEKVASQFSAADLETVDQDFETTYWPGGSALPTASIPVSPGSSANAGIIQVHKVPFYRVHVSVPHVECGAGEKWTLRTASSVELTLLAPRPVPCTNDFLVTNLRPGAYSFMLSSNSTEGAPGKWAFANVDISNKNIELALTLEPLMQIAGRVVAANGATLPPLSKIKVSVGGGDAPAFPDAEGKFVVGNLEFPNHRVLVDGLAKDYYIKEICLNGAASPGDDVALSPGANQLEIVIDDKPGTISGRVSDGGNPAVKAEVKLYPKDPPTTGVLSLAGVLPITGGTVRTDEQGNFQIKGLTPGEYRIVAWQPPSAPRATGYGDLLPQLAARARSITVERGGTANVTLPLSDPSR